MTGEETKGIKETREVAVAAVAIAFVVIELSKDGLQLADAMALYNELQSKPELKAKFDAALAGVSQVPAEVKDLTGAEGVQLAMAVVQEVMGQLA